MRIIPLLVVGALAAPAQANLQEDYRTQQEEQAVIQERRTDLCENHRAQAQFERDNFLYRISRGDLYQIRWTGPKPAAGALSPHPCEIKLLGRIDTDNKVCENQSLGCDPRSTTRWVVEGDELVSYSTWNFGGGAYTGQVRRSVLATAR